MQKLPFEAPKLEITYFEAEDIIRTSGDQPSDGDPGGHIPEMPWETWP